MTPRSGSVAIVIPCHQLPLDRLAQVAYRRIWELYAHLPIILAAPPGLEISPLLAETPKLKVERFEFRTVRDYSQLLLQPSFYERFRQYSHILIHQLDAYLLKDELLEWCARDYDYVGAPLFHGYEPAEPEGKLWCVGNGGFSLRKTASALAVLGSTRRFRTPAQHWAERPRRANLQVAVRWAWQSLAKLSRFHNDVRWATLNNFHEDIFWSVEAPHFWPAFQLPSVETGLRFAFDYAPAYCYEMNQRQLPFGCHAWPRYDLNFWRKFIPLESSASRGASPD